VNLKDNAKARIVSVKISGIQFRPTSIELIEIILTVKNLRLEVLLKRKNRPILATNRYF
jgi:hypothetical protein